MIVYKQLSLLTWNHKQKRLILGLKFNICYLKLYIFINLFIFMNDWKHLLLLTI